MDVYALKVTLLGTRPPVWRRFLIEGDVTLRSLHGTLQIVMGWANSHLHQFVFQQQKQPDNMELSDLLKTPGTRLLYEYDLGDGWQHELVLEEVLAGDASFRRMCVAGARSCPPEDCGGPYGYVDLLRAIHDRSHPEHDSLLEWIGGRFDA